MVAGANDDRPGSTVLHCVCGALCAGRAAVARELARDSTRVLVCEREWLTHLFPTPPLDLADDVRRIARLRGVLGPHLTQLLNRGVDVVVDFGGNTPEERRWLKSLTVAGRHGIALYVLDASAPGHSPSPVTTTAAGAVLDRPPHLDATVVRSFFLPPEPSEGFAVEIRRYAP
jgi:predicted kinase